MSIYDGPGPIDLSKIKTYELASRGGKVETAGLASPPTESDTLREFLSRLPDVLAVRSIRQVAEAVRRARGLGKPVIWGIGGHVIKTGLAPVLIDLMDRGFVSAVAANGSVMVHDAELALVGATSEDVDASLGKGEFGAARETGEVLNEAAAEAVARSIGLGEAIGVGLISRKPAFESSSLLCEAYKRKIPFTAHITLGADIGHFHPSADGAALGAASHTDFRLFCSLVRQMNGGGVYINFGSAVTMPEIFLKAITVVRNLGHELTDITTADFDFVQHYRPLTNVVRRPVANGVGRGYSVTGHHELMLPLLAAQIVVG